VTDSEHTGHAISVPMSGARRHPSDTDTTVVLTLYGQDGTLQELPVARTRSNELFQEWLRRFDRYTVRGESE
jgi:hypothetical protein